MGRSVYPAAQTYQTSGEKMIYLRERGWGGHTTLTSCVHPWE